MQPQKSPLSPRLHPSPHYKPHPHYHPSNRATQTTPVLHTLILATRHVQQWLNCEDRLQIRTTRCKKWYNQMYTLFQRELEELCVSFWLYFQCWWAIRSRFFFKGAVCAINHPNVCHMSSGCLCVFFFMLLIKTILKPVPPDSCRRVVFKTWGQDLELAPDADGILRWFLRLRTKNESAAMKKGLNAIRCKGQM